MSDRSFSGYEALANGIVLQAVKDYRAAIHRVKAHPDKSEIAMQEVKDLERFFRSGWYQILTQVDGEYLINEIREQEDFYL